MSVKMLNGLAALAAVVATVAFTTSRTRVTAAVPDQGPALESAGVMTFAPDGVLFLADTKGATIYALDLGAQANGGKPGAADVASIDQKIAAMLGTETAAITVIDLVTHHNA